MNPRTVLITGANGGLGLATAHRFLLDSSGHRVGLGVRHRREAAAELCERFPERASLVELDVVSPGSWEAAIAQFGPVDILVNNAGIHRDSLLATMPPESWHGVLDANLTGTFLGCQAVVRGMMGRHWGRIINIASLSALLAPAGQTNYAAAKAGVVALTQSLAKEVARAGITVNAICPGFIETEALASLDPAVRKSMTARVPMRRFGDPADVASAVAFFASDEAGYITGAVLKVDGGLV